MKFPSKILRNILIFQSLEYSYKKVLNFYFLTSLWNLNAHVADMNNLVFLILKYAGARYNRRALIFKGGRLFKLAAACFS